MDGGSSWSEAVEKWILPPDYKSVPTEQLHAMERRGVAADREIVERAAKEGLAISLSRVMSEGAEGVASYAVPLEGLAVKALGMAAKEFGAAKSIAMGTKESLQAVNLSGRIKASGMNLSEAGKLFGWGPAGRMDKPLSAFSKESLEAAGWSRETIASVAQGYREIAKITPGNRAALPRAEQLESLLKLWKSP